MLRLHVKVDELPLALIILLLLLELSFIVILEALFYVLDILLLDFALAEPLHVFGGLSQTGSALIVLVGLQIRLENIFIFPRSVQI